MFAGILCVCVCLCFTVINQTQFAVQAIYTSVTGSSAQIYLGHVTVFRTSLQNTLRLGCVWLMPTLALPNVGKSWLANFLAKEFLALIWPLFGKNL